MSYFLSFHYTIVLNLDSLALSIYSEKVERVEKIRRNFKLYYLSEREGCPPWIL